MPITHGAWTACGATDDSRRRDTSLVVSARPAERDSCAGVGGGTPMTFQRERDESQMIGDPGVGRTPHSVTAALAAPKDRGIPVSPAIAFTFRVPPPMPAPWGSARFRAFWRTRPL